MPPNTICGIVLALTSWRYRISSSVLLSTAPAIMLEISAALKKVAVSISIVVQPKSRISSMWENYAKIISMPRFFTVCQLTLFSVPIFSLMSLILPNNCSLGAIQAPRIYTFKALWVLILCLKQLRVFVRLTNSTRCCRLGTYSISFSIQSL